MIEFEEGSHTYKLSGKLVPSVTKVLEPLVDFSMIPSEVLERKRTLGIAVHRGCELINLGTLDERSVHPEVAPYLEQYKKFLKASKFDCRLTEQRVASKRYRYAGTLDLWGYLNGRSALIDIKTAQDVSPVYGLQTAAYKAALEEWNGHQSEDRFILRLEPTKYWLEIMEQSDDLSTFYAALTLHHWRTKNA